MKRLQDRPPVRLETAGPARSAFLAGLLFLAVCLRLNGISDHGPYWDEIFQLVRSVGGDLLRPVNSLDSSFAQEDVWRENTVQGVGRAAGFDPPVFNLLLHGWMQLFGTSDLAARLPSVISGVVLVFLIFRLSAILFSEQVAWIAAFLATFHPLFVRYSQEARGRMLAMVFAVVATLLFARILWAAAKGSVRRVALTSGYAVSMTLALLTHNMCFGVFVGHVAYTLLRVRDRKALVSVLAAWLAACFCVAIWVASAAEALDYLARMQAVALQRAASGDSGGGFLYPSTPRFLAAGLVKVFLSMAALDVQPTLLGLGFRVRDFAWLVALPLILIWAGRRGRGNLDGGRALLGMIVGSVSIELLGLAWWSGHTTSLRPHYAAFGAPFLAPLLAVGIVGLFRESTWTKGFLALFLLVQGAAMAIGLGEVYTDEILWHRPPNGFAALASQIVAVVRPGDVVVFPTWADARITNLYLRRSPPIRQRVVQKPWADASILGGYGFPNTPQQSVAVVQPTREPIIVVTAEGRERARFAHPIYW